MLSVATKFALGFLLLDVLGVCGFVIRDEHSSDKALTSDLSDALKLLERQRRQLDTGYYRDENELPPLEYFGDRLPYPYDDADIPSVPSEGYDLPDPQSSDRQISLDDLYRTLKSEKENNKKETTSDDELNQIFDTQDNDNNSENALDSSESKETDDSKLIEQARKTVPAPAVGDDLEDTPASDELDVGDIKPVSKEQLDTLFESVVTDADDESESPTSNADTNETGSIEVETKPEELEILKNYIQETGSKNKRMAKRGSPRDRILNEKDKEIEALKEEVARLSIKEKLENEEIDALADALDKVTHGEIIGTDDVEGEFNDLERAIKIEETLNSLSEIEYGEAFGNGEEPGEDGEAIGNAKRLTPEKAVDVSDLSLSDADGKWDDEAPTNEANDVSDIFVDRNADDIDPRDRFIQIDSDRDTENLLDDKVVTPEEIREAISELEPWEKVELAKELAELSEDSRRREQLVAPYNRCPDMNPLTSNCVFAAENGIYMDEEARELCNRHEMCYACGSTFHISVYKCDAGYLGDAIEACNDRDGCKTEAKQFLLEMKTRHMYSPRAQPYCSDRCIKDFIFGVA